MGAPAKTRSRDQNVHMYFQLVLFFSIMTGLNLAPDNTNPENRRPQIVSTAPEIQSKASSSRITNGSDSISIPEPYPSNRVRWGIQGRPEPGSSGQFEIWDISQSPTRKMVQIFNTEGHYPTGFLPDATIFLEPGGRVRLPVAIGTYRIEAIAGTNWNGRDFGPDGVKVGFRTRSIIRQQITVLAIGAKDEPVIELNEKTT